MQLDTELMGDLIAELISEHVAKAIKPLQEEIAALKISLAAFVVPKDGKDADPELVRAEVARAVAEIPKPEDGKSVDVGVLFTEIGQAVRNAVDAVPKPRDGKDFDPAALDLALARATEDTNAFVVAEIEKRIAALPKGIDQADMNDAVNKAIQSIGRRHRG